MKHRHLYALAALCIFLSLPAHALISSEASLSGGYFKDYTEEHRIPVFFTWNLNHIATNGIETYVDLGANNNLIQNKWGFYVYQGYVTVPFSTGFDSAPAKRTRLQLGRQLLTEGFEFTILDGVQAPYYWSENGGINLIAGASYAIQTKKLDFAPVIYGATAHQKFLGARWQAGALHKEKESASENLAHGSVLWSFETLPLKPLLIGRSQWNLSESAHDQAYAEFGLYPNDQLNAGVLYSKRKISFANVDPLEGLIIYKTFAISAVDSKGAFVTWMPSQFLTVQTQVRRANYTSSAVSGRPETGDEQEVQVTWLHKTHTISPFFARVTSYGGTVLQPGMNYRLDLSNKSALKVQVAASKIDKINGMNSWAYHGRGGVDFKIGPRFTVMTLGEAESNHFYKVDARVLGYLSYLLY